MHLADVPVRVVVSIGIVERVTEEILFRVVVLLLVNCPSFRLPASDIVGKIGLAQVMNVIR
ncbi:hypothetical protein D3C87_2101490 [compost metagenome]